MFRLFKNLIRKIELGLLFSQVSRKPRFMLDPTELRKALLMRQSHTYNFGESFKLKFE